MVKIYIRKIEDAREREEGEEEKKNVGWLQFQLLLLQLDSVSHLMCPFEIYYSCTVSCTAFNSVSTNWIIIYKCTLAEHIYGYEIVSPVVALTPFYAIQTVYITCSGYSMTPKLFAFSIAVFFVCMFCCQHNYTKKNNNPIPKHPQTIWIESNIK